MPNVSQGWVRVPLAPRLVHGGVGGRGSEWVGERGVGGRDGGAKLGGDGLRKAKCPPLVSSCLI